MHDLVAQGRFAGLAGGIAQQALDASLDEAFLPAPHCRPADPGASGDRGDLQPLGRAEDDPSPRHVLLGAVAIGDDRLQTSTILSRDTLHLDQDPGADLAKLHPLNAPVH